ncbi:hypothetical protein [Geminicoccus roseus]|uniref:hypothetical protein n=1 Tax=Geminicoccus roseus TaxID=404900 RepID=UPI0012F78096|nr:hypothetical protein [Geminicoccus roseus]
MAFVPLNDDHAVASCDFALALSRPLPRSAISELQSLAASLAAELPASAMVQPSDVDDAIVPIISNGAPGIELAYLRPDGSPVWALRLINNEIFVSCTRYTRWEKSWDQARSYLWQALAKLALIKFEAAVAVIALRVVDRFSSNEDTAKIDDLFQRHSWLPDPIFAGGPLWHNHSGWYSDHDSGPTLNNLNLTAQRVQDGQGPARIVIDIVHRLQLRLRSSEILSQDSIQSIQAVIDQHMNDLHLNNKVVLHGLLQPVVLDRIGLKVTPNA